MILIIKGPEPHVLTEYRLDRSNGEPTYNGLQNRHKDVLESLIKEQGGLCAYCMCRIPQDEKKHAPPASIEHIDPQSNSDNAKALNYGNMLAVCSGNRNPADKTQSKLHKKHLTCDAHRGNQSLTVNPLIASTLESIKYSNEGIIFSDITEINKDLNETLNLNCKAIQLPQARLQAKNALIEAARKHGKADISSFATKHIERLKSAEQKPPFVGILIDWLVKHQHKKR